MGFKNTSSLAVIIAAILLGVFYIRPALATIGELQDEIFIFKDNADKATEINVRLQEIQNEIAGLRQSDIVALETYLPTEVDVLQVMHDIETIADNAGLVTSEIRPIDAEELTTIQENDTENLDISEEDRAAAESLDAVDREDIEMVLEGRYENFKQFLEQIAVNDYPLEVAMLEFGTADEQAADTEDERPPMFTVIVRTYAFNYLRNR